MAPFDIDIVIMTGRSSGVTPTAKAIAKRNELKAPFPKKKFIIKINIAIIKTTFVRKLPKLLIPF